MSNKELDEAIATLQVMETNPFDTKWKRALRLGIEALGAYRQARIERQLSPNELLPSETEGEK